MKAAIASKVVAATLAGAAVSCTLAVSFDSYDVEPTSTTVRLYAAAGNVSGLDGTQQLTLRWNGGVISSAGNGPFAFAPSVADGLPWQLEAFGAQCTANPDKGVIAGRDVAGIDVRCGLNAQRMDATLKALSVTSAYWAMHLVPAFNPSNSDYSLVPDDPTGFFPSAGALVRATAVAHQVRATVTIAAQAVGADEGATVDLRVHNPIEVVVRAENGVSTQRYSVTYGGDPARTGP